MTQQQLEQRLEELEREVAEQRREIKPLRPLRSVPETFGMFADDPEFEDVARLGREYRDQVNAGNPNARPRYRPSDRIPEGDIGCGTAAKSAARLGDGCHWRGL